MIPLAGLLGETPGSSRTFAAEDVLLALDDDLVLARPVNAQIEVSRTNRGLLVAGSLSTALSMDCSRCLGPAIVPLEVPLLEEVLPAIDPTTGQAQDTSAEPDVARLTDHHELDFEQLLREAILLAAPIAPRCRPDCPGLCTECGQRIDDRHQGHDEHDVDPRLAALRAFRVDADAQSE